MIEKNVDKKLPNRIRYQIWYKRCLKESFVGGSKSAKWDPNPLWYRQKKINKLRQPSEGLKKKKKKKKELTLRSWSKNVDELN